MAVTAWLDLLEPLSESPPAPNPGGAGEGYGGEAPSLSLVDLEAVQAEADALLDAARAEAAVLIEDAQVQAESLREAAWQEGLHEGAQEARAQVEAELRAEWEARRDGLRAEMDALAAHVGAAREELWRRQEPEMIGLALDIARQVVKAEIAQNPDVVRQVLSNAIRRISDKDNVRVRVSLGDAPRVKEMRQDLMDVLDGLRHLEILDDRRVGDGGCVIETNAGTIDAKIETQMAEVARALGVAENG